MLSNKDPVYETIENKEQICFLSYDFKNSIEAFSSKKNNPLRFPDKLFIEAEKVIPYNELKFDIEDIKAQTISLTHTVTKEQYIKQVNELKSHIQLGDIYEINYCITFEANDVDIDPLYIYQKLNAISNASYSALVKLNSHYIICSSPELFLSKKGDTLYTKPIKGTAKRGLGQTEDEFNKQQLQSSLKEQTENVMIVDVARNDLSRVAKRGSVVVDKLFDIESYQQVHQMVSTVSCKLKEQVSINNIIEATFPMASMTGAPKIRAMQLIDQYEVYNRNAYSGSIGYINRSGDFDLNVLIRSVFFNRDEKYLSFTVGSAITALCNPEDEYEECLLKAKAMINALMD